MGGYVFNLHCMKQAGGSKIKFCDLPENVDPVLGMLGYYFAFKLKTIL